MAYTDSPSDDAKMRQKIRSILETKMQDPLYKGEGIKSNKALECRVHDILTQINNEQENKHPYLYSRNSAQSMGYGIADYMVGQAKRKRKNPNKVKSGRKASKTNPWVTFLRQWMKTHPCIPGKQALKAASIAYREQKK